MITSTSTEHDLPSRQVRLQARSGELTGTTANLAPAYVQANMAVLPASLAADFLRFCQRNPKPCPLIGVSEPGSPRVPELGADLDVRTDIPRYRVWRHGELVAEPTDAREYWQDDFVSFLIGCSFSFEQAMLENGLPVRHIEMGTIVPMYRTNIPTHEAGPFKGPVVVSMRPMKAADAIRAIQITSRFPNVHGAPLHFGNPKQIGIADIDRPDYGEPVNIADDEVPVFWACGVTPQSVIATVKPEVSITHAPGHMLVTDILNSRIAIL